MTRLTQSLAAAAAILLALGAARADQEVPAIAPREIPDAILHAVSAPDRPNTDKELDGGRQPAQMLAFFRAAPGMTAADLYAGGGYTTELLARIAGPKGKVYSQEPIFPPDFKSIEDAWTSRLQKSTLANVVAVHKNVDSPDFLPASPGSLDLVVVNMNYHDWVIQKRDRDMINGAVFRALKSGGVYGIVDHSAKPGSGDESLQLHRIDEGFVTREIEKAGFKLDAASSALRHPADDRTWNTSPRSGDTAKRGTSDRFMLRFVKP